MSAPAPWNVLEHLGERRVSQLSGEERGRIAATMGMIPEEVTTILDVGCGDGRMVRRLAGCYRTVGVDYAFSSVRHLAGNAARASLDHLPFGDQSFDLTLCCEVLEHLPADTFRAAIDELERVSRKHILISVPYKENLRLMNTKCQRCQAVFHMWGHLRRFSNRDLDTLFGSYRVKSTRYFGRRPPYYSRAILRINQKLGGRWAEFDDTTICPRCGNTAFTPTPRNPVTIACGVANLLTSRLVPVSNRNWVLKLYSRVDGGRGRVAAD